MGGFFLGLHVLLEVEVEFEFEFEFEVEVVEDEEDDEFLLDTSARTGTGAFGPGVGIET